MEKESEYGPLPLFTLESNVASETFDNTVTYRKS